MTSWGSDTISQCATIVPNEHWNAEQEVLWLITDSEWALIARFMGPTWGPSGADRTQVGPMLAAWTLLSGALLGLHTLLHNLCMASICRAYYFEMSLLSLTGMGINVDCLERSEGVAWLLVQRACRRLVMKILNFIFTKWWNNSTDVKMQIQPLEKCSYIYDLL